MKIETTKRVEMLPDGKTARVTVAVLVDGLPCGETTVASGPFRDIEEFWSGRLTLSELRDLWSGPRAGKPLVDQVCDQWKAARLDADRTAKPLTQLVRHVPEGDCVGPGTHPNAPMELETVGTGERLTIR